MTMKKPIIVVAAVAIMITSLMSSCKVTETRCPAYSKHTTQPTVEKRS